MAFERRGPFLLRRGPAHARGETRCAPKLCFAATDRDLLASVLDEFATDERCHTVKYAAEPRDGMYLGRCLMTDATRVGELWRRFKRHPRLLCTVQDDDFTAPFRGT